MSWKQKAAALRRAAAMAAKEIDAGREARRPQPPNAGRIEPTFGQPQESSPLVPYRQEAAPSPGGVASPLAPGPTLWKPAAVLGAGALAYDTYGYKEPTEEEKRAAVIKAWGIPYNKISDYGPKDFDQMYYMISGNNRHISMLDLFKSWAGEQLR